MEKEFPIVKVVWVDAMSSDEWTEIEHVDKKTPSIDSVGYLLEDSENVVIAQSIDSDNFMAAMTMTIPGGWVESVEYL